MVGGRKKYKKFFGGRYKQKEPSSFGAQLWGRV